MLTKSPDTEDVVGLLQEVSGPERKRRFLRRLPRTHSRLATLRLLNTAVTLSGTIGLLLDLTGANSLSLV